MKAMKKILTILFTFCIIGCTMNNPPPSHGKIFDEKHGSSASNSAYLNELEKAVVKEMNLARTNPSLYAEKYIEPMLEQFNGMIFTGYGYNLRTNEGAAAVRKCITVMKSIAPMTALQPDESLAHAAKDWVDIQSPTSNIGHGSGADYFATRIARYGTWRGCAENIAYGFNDARRIIVQLLIDDGVSNRGHRANIFGNYTHVGVSCGGHQTYRYMCVQDFGIK